MSNLAGDTGPGLHKAEEFGDLLTQTFVFRDEGLYMSFLGVFVQGEPEQSDGGGEAGIVSRV